MSDLVPKQQKNNKFNSFLKIIKLIPGWFFGIIMLLLAIGELENTGNLLVALPVFLISLILLPPTKSLTKKLLKKDLSFKAKAISIIILFFFYMFTSIQNEDRKQQEQAVKEFHENKPQIIAEIENKIQLQEYQEAVKLISSYLDLVSDEALIELQEKAKTEEAAYLKKKEITELLAKVKKVPSSDYRENMQLYKRLSELDPENKTYSVKLESYTDKYNKEQERLRRQAERKKKIEEQFSAWDGSHLKLTQYIKDNMNDPKSYEHVKTVYWDKGDHLVVRTTFRGKNAFGGVVINHATAYVTLNGLLLGVEFND